MNNGLTYLWIWLSFRWVIRIFVAKKLTPRGIIPRGVKKRFNQREFLLKPFNSRIRNHIYFCDTVPLKACSKVLRKGCWLPGVLSDPGELDSPGMWPRGDMMKSLVPWLPGVWYPGEIDSPDIIPRQDWLRTVWYPGESCFYTAFFGKTWLFYSLYLLNLMRYKHQFFLL